MVDTAEYITYRRVVLVVGARVAVEVIRRRHGDDAEQGEELGHVLQWFLRGVCLFGRGDFVVAAAIVHQSGDEGAPRLLRPRVRKRAVDTVNDNNTITLQQQSKNNSIAGALLIN